MIFRIFLEENSMSVGEPYKDFLSPVWVGIYWTDCLAIGRGRRNSLALLHQECPCAPVAGHQSSWSQELWILVRYNSFLGILTNPGRLSTISILSSIVGLLGFLGFRHLGLLDFTRASSHFIDSSNCVLTISFPCIQPIN